MTGTRGKTGPKPLVKSPYKCKVTIYLPVIHPRNGTVANKRASQCPNDPEENGLCRDHIAMRDRLMESLKT